MELSARNVLAGEMLEVGKGAITAHARLESPRGATIAASVADGAADEPGLEAGEQACAAAKACGVTVGEA